MSTKSNSKAPKLKNLIAKSELSYLIGHPVLEGLYVELHHKLVDCLRHHWPVNCKKSNMVNLYSNKLLHGSPSQY